MFVQKKNGVKQVFMKIRNLIKPRNYTVIKTSPAVKIIRDIKIPTRDGKYLSANLYMPSYKGRFPVLLSLYSGRKDVLCKDGYMHIQYRFARQPGLIQFSDETSFEAPDPNFWALNGYAILNIDKRGFGTTPGDEEPQNFFDDGEILDIVDAIEWAGKRGWSNGNVGLIGVSYLAINQYKVAALGPKYLKAICPWEGVSDLYSDWFYHGGVREDGFTPFFSKRVGTFGHAADMRKLQLEHEIRDEYWKSFAPEFSKIKVPMFNCVSGSCQMFHSGGSYRAYLRSGSEEKWLYTHRNGEWTEYYSQEVILLMLKFFNRYLKDINNDIENHPRVRLEIREFGHEVKEVRYCNQFPPDGIVWEKLRLHNGTGLMSQENLKPGNEENEKSGGAKNFDLNKGSLSYTYTFDQDTEIIGPMTLTLNIQLEGCNDANLFVGLQKYHEGQEVNFEGVYGFPNDILARSALRVALRRTNDKSTDYYPDYDFDQIEFLEYGEVGKLVFRFSPSATYFRKGDELRLVIQGRYFINSKKIHQAFDYKPSEKGTCILTDSPENALLLPLMIVK